MTRFSEVAGFRWMFLDCIRLAAYADFYRGWKYQTDQSEEIKQLAESLPIPGIVGFLMKCSDSYEVEPYTGIWLNTKGRHSAEVLGMFQSAQLGTRNSPISREFHCPAVAGVNFCLYQMICWFVGFFDFLGKRSGSEETRQYQESRSNLFRIWIGFHFGGTGRLGRNFADSRKLSFSQQAGVSQKRLLLPPWFLRDTWEWNRDRIDGILLQSALDLDPKAGDLFQVLALPSRCRWHLSTRFQVKWDSVADASGAITHWHWFRVCVCVCLIFCVAYLPPSWVSEMKHGTSDATALRFSKGLLLISFFFSRKKDGGRDESPQKISTKLQKRKRLQKNVFTRKREKKNPAKIKSNKFLLLPSFHNKNNNNNNHHHHHHHHHDQDWTKQRKWINKQLSQTPG